MALMLLSCGDGGKAQTAPEEEIHEFEIVGKKEPIDTDNEPVSVSSILSGKTHVDDSGGDDGLAGQYVDPLGGDESYLEGDGYDY